MLVVVYIPLQQDLARQISLEEAEEILQDHALLIEEWKASTKLVIQESGERLHHLRALLELIEDPVHALDVWQFVFHYNIAIMTCAFEIEADPGESRRVLRSLVSAHPPLGWVLSKSCEDVSPADINPDLAPRAASAAHQRLIDWLGV